MQQRGRRTSEQEIWTDEDAFDTDEEEYDDGGSIRMRTSVRRYSRLPDVKAEVGRRHPDVQPVTKQPSNYYADIEDEHMPLRRTATHASIPGDQRQRVVRTDEVADQRSDQPARSRTRKGTGFHPHWPVVAGFGMLIMILGWVVLSAFMNWWQITQDDWHYGRPRTFQTDAVVGHTDSPTSPSHFIAMNFNRRIEIIEFPGGDTTKAKIYMGPMLIGQGQDLAAVTLSFKDVNGDGKPDMIVNVQDSRFVFINDNGGFRPARPNENIHT